MIDQNLHKEFLERIKDNEGIIYKICNSYCSNKADREDLGQEIIYQLLKSYSTFNDTNKFSTWMYRVALNVAISFYRKRKTGDVITLVEKQEDKEDDNKHAVHLENNITRMHQFISELKELDKALMILYLESKNYKEIAEILGITETNVATKISRIKEILRQKFSTFN